MDKILKKVKKKLQPGESSMKHVEVTVRKINKALDKKGINAECFLGGSFAKNTHLRGDHDVDVFVRFDKDEYSGEDISEILAEALPFEAERLHGSRDYFQAERYNLQFEIVPVLRVENHEEAENVTDMSPLHVKYVKKHEEGMNDEIRLAKKFCKANKVYGAESYIQGFSGHVIDLLVVFYGGFKKFIKAASNWGNRVVIDMEFHWSNPLKQLNKSKIESPLVLVDPIQPHRNAAAALSRDKFELFKSRCNQFLDNPSEDFFINRSLDFEEVAEDYEDAHVICFNAWPYKDKDDVMGAKLRQVHEYVFRKVEDRQWPMIEADWEFEKGENYGKFYFIISKDAEEFIERKGPPVSMNSEVKKFTNKHSNTYVSGGRVYARIDRRHSDPKSLIEDVLGHKYVQERIKRFKFVEVPS